MAKLLGSLSIIHGKIELHLEKRVIGIIIAVYSNYPERLFQSCMSDDIPVRWYVFLHGKDEALESSLRYFSETTKNVLFLPFRHNRGLAQSWNDGLRFSEAAGDEFAIIVNDDLFFRPAGFEAFVAYVRALDPNYGLATMMGLESESSPSAGQIIAQEFACGVIGRMALQVVGYLDQNYSPAYFEDVDYIQRLHLAGLPIRIDDRVLVEHDRSSTIRSSEEISDSFQISFSRNKKYFETKWGGAFGVTKFTTPFGNPQLSLFIPYATASDPYPSSRDVPGYPASTTSDVLDEVGRRHGTEKSSLGHDFLSFYESLLASRRQQITSLLEIGVAAGASVDMWTEYLPNARVIAVDMDASCLAKKSERVTVEIFDQSNPRHLSGTASRHGPFDLIIDDGSHIWSHQILAFQVLFPFLNPDGLFIIENIDTSYGEYVHTFGRVGSISTADYLKKVLDSLVGDSALARDAESDLFIAHYSGYIRSISFIRRGCVIVRNNRP